MRHFVLSITVLLLMGVVTNGQSWEKLNDSLLHYYNQGDYNTAIQFAEKAVVQAKKEFGVEDKDYVTSLNILAALYYMTGNYAKAEPLYVELLNIRKKVLGEEHPDYALSLNNLAGLYERMGNYAQAKPLYVGAMSICKKVLGEEHPDYALSLNNLAGLYESMGSYTQAEALYVEALNIRKKVLGEEHPDYANSLNNLAALYYNMGNHAQAESLNVEAMNIFKKVLGEEHPDYASSLNNLAVLYERMGNYAQAESLNVEAMNIFKKVLGEDHPNYALSLSNLAVLYERMGNYTQAESLYVGVISIYKKILGEEHPNYALSLNNLAYLYYIMSDYVRAEPLYKEVLNIRKKILGEEHPDYAISLDNLGYLYESMNSYMKAEPLVIKGFEIATNHILANISNLSEKEKNNWISKNGFQNENLLSIQNNHKEINTASTRFILNQQFVFKSLILADTKGILQSIQTSKDSALQKIYSNWKNIKKQLAQQYSLPIAERSTELANWEKQAESLEKELNRKSSVFREQQQSLRIKTTDVQKGLINYEASIEFVRFNLFNKKWTDSTMYAAYILTKKDSIPVFVPLFEEKQLQKLFDSAGTSSDAMVSKFYRGLDLGNTGTSASLGKDLYNLVWAPLEPYLKGIKKISYSPAGKLYSIAFHALPVDSATLLMDKYELNQYTSTRQVALRKAQEINKIQNIALFGNATFTLDSAAIAKVKTGNQSISNIYVPQNRGSRGGTWSDLPGTAEEVKKVKQLFEQNRISTKSFTQTTATEENLKALSGNSPQVLHIATHGFFLPDPQKKRKDMGMNNENTYSLADDPLLRSGLILAGGNYAWSGKTPVEGVEDGIATAYEISQLNLSNTELVVLSACETALGDVKGSEGVFGLQRAFKMAGVKKMIVSLWQVPDKETAELMTSFYNYWLKGKNIEQAFTQAQADMRKKYSPYYWAAFVLVE